MRRGIASFVFRLWVWVVNGLCYLVMCLGEESVLCLWDFGPMINEHDELEGGMLRAIFGRVLGGTPGFLQSASLHL